MAKTKPADLARILQWQRDNPEKVAARVKRWNNRQNAKRGLFYSNCNTGVGLFKDNPDWLKRAAEYVWTYYDKAPVPPPAMKEV
jgi:hypothetical protein